MGISGLILLERDQICTDFGECLQVEKNFAIFFRKLIRVRQHNNKSDRNTDNCLTWESSFNMTRGDEDVEGGTSENF